ncbi:magnesium transporter CorA family protein [Candidatus Woesearchaeota archaeon]|nr:magnesium transporter CorA family protein [Candidatus Woesearchaeota archaeon]
MLRYLYVSKGVVKSGSKADYRKPGRDALLWVFLIEPTGKEISRVVGDFGLEEKPFEVYSKEHHSVRYSMDPFVFVIVDYFVDNGRIGSAHILFVVRDNVLIVCTSKAARFYDELFDSISSHVGANRHKVFSVGRILHAFLQEDVEENYDVLEKTEEEIVALEERAAHYEAKHATSVKDIVKLKRRMFMMGRRFWASTKIIFLLKAGFTNVRLDAETSKLLVDVHDTFLHQIDIATAQKEMLSDVMNIYSTSINNRLAMVSNELNVIMKKLSSFALILLLPTLIASVYGMNLHLPFQQSAYGFYFVAGSMGLVTIMLVYFFRKRGWL